MVDDINATLFLSENVLNSTLLNIISMIGTFMVLLSIFYFLSNAIICKVFKLNKLIVLNKFLLSDILSLFISFFIIINFISISSPYA